MRSWVPHSIIIKLALFTEVYRKSKVTVFKMAKIYFGYINGTRSIYIRQKCSTCIAISRLKGISETGWFHLTLQFQTLPELSKPRLAYIIPYNSEYPLPLEIPDYTPRELLNIFF